MIRSLLVATLALAASLPPATAASGEGRDRERVNGSINITEGDRAGARLNGDLIFEKPSAGVSLDFGGPPRVVIGPDASVVGTLRFGREVKLYVSDRAKVAKIEGATPIRFGGNAPPND